jgi:uncharacterized protein (DUF302 family)
MGTSEDMKEPTVSSPVPFTAARVASQPSPYSVDGTLQRLEQVIRSRGMTLFAHFDHSGEAARAGLTMQPAHVLVFGNPRAGTALMVASPLIALDLPLKVLVWQDDRGHVWVTYNRPTSMAERYAIPRDLVRVIAGVDGIVQAALSSDPEH